MSSIETLKRIVRSIDSATRPSQDDWAATETVLRIELPHSLKELLNEFGHGVWGRDLIFLHPKGASYQRLCASRILQLKEFTDPAVQGSMPSDDPANWDIIPIGCLPYRAQILQSRKSEEIIIYDGDYCKDLKTGTVEVSKFISESLRWRDQELTGIWREFAEANFPVELPVFTAKCRRDHDGFFAEPP
jgi:hypothetical protein